MVSLVSVAGTTQLLQPKLIGTRRIGINQLPNHRVVASAAQLDQKGRTTVDLGLQDMHEAEANQRSKFAHQWSKLVSKYSEDAHRGDVACLRAAGTFAAAGQRPVEAGSPQVNRDELLFFLLGKESPEKFLAPGFRLCFTS